MKKEHILQLTVQLTMWKPTENKNACVENFVECDEESVRESDNIEIDVIERICHKRHMESNMTVVLDAIDKDINVGLSDNSARS